MARALIVVDVQNGFLREGNLASEHCLAVLPAVQDEVDRALAADERVFFTADTHEPDDLEFEIFPPHCIRGTHEAELVDELKGYLERDDCHLIPSRRYSALFETQLEGLLHRFNIDEVRVCGVCTDICVQQTVADLRNRDIGVTVVGAGTATFDAPGHGVDETHQFALGYMEKILGATIEHARAEATS